MNSAERGRPAAPVDETALEQLLSRPSPALVDEFARLAGDIVILGAGGKMGPTMAIMARRALDEAGRSRSDVIAVSRWTDRAAAERLRRAGVRVHVAEVGIDSDLAALPDAANLIYLIGAKFGVSSQPHVAWTTNTVLPAVVARRYATSRIVALSTGNVYPLVPAGTPGADETVPPAPVGEYAMSCLGRERVIEAASAQYGTKAALIRLNYAVELRYGVITDLATKLVAGAPIDESTPQVNVVWARYANEVVLRTLLRADNPPFVLNVTGVPAVPVRSIVDRLADRLGVPARYQGTPADTCLLSDARRCQVLYGDPEVDLDTLLSWQVDWLAGGQPVWAKATKFERRDGRF
jgi:NAD dependent epimerase/dehydratase family